MKLNDQLYEILKWVSLILLPSCGALYASLSGLWGLPYPLEVVGTLEALGLFIGAIIGISTVNYRKGED